MSENLKSTQDIRECITFPHNIFFNILITPFRLKNGQTKTTSESFTLQKFLCALFTICSFMSYCVETFFMDTSHKISNRSSSNPLILFQTGYSVFLTIRRILTIKFLWIDSQKIISLLNQLHKLPSNMANSKSFMVRPSVLNLLGVANLVLSLISFFGKRQLFLCGIWLKFTNGSVESLLQDVVLAIILLHGHYFFLATCAYPFCIIILMCALSKSFKTFIKESMFLCTEQQHRLELWSEIERQLNELRVVANLINNAVGNIISCFACEMILHYAVNMEQVFAGDHDHSTPLTVAFFFYFALTCINFLMAADVANNIGYLKEWLLVKENRAVVHPPWDLGILWAQLESNSVGTIKMSGIYPITYPFLGTVSCFL